MVFYGTRKNGGLWHEKKNGGLWHWAYAIRPYGMAGHIIGIGKTAFATDLLGIFRICRKWRWVSHAFGEEIEKIHCGP